MDKSRTLKMPPTAHLKLFSKQSCPRQFPAYSFIFGLNYLKFLDKTD